MKLFSVAFILCFYCFLADEDALKDSSASNHLFTASIYKKIQEDEDGNFLVSPFSAESILAFLHSGAKNTTAEEIQAALYLPPQGNVETAYKILQPIFRKSDYLLKLANKIYVNKDFDVKNGFKKTAIDVFDAEIESADFNKKDEVATTMNQWVENRTDHNIKNLILPSDLNENTKAILINALYFEGKWPTPLNKFFTDEQDFYKNGKEIITVKTMHTFGRKRYSESRELDAIFLELPFRGGDVTLTIVLPNNKENISALEQHFEKVLESQEYREESLQVALPKFKIESRLDFKKILQELGVNKAFTPGQSDFSGIVENNFNFYIDAIMQKTFINVNENGVQAGAATFSSGVTFGMSAPQKMFIANHPFIFYIKVRDLLLFVGRVVDPSQ